MTYELVTHVINEWVLWYWSVDR